MLLSQESDMAEMPAYAIKCSDVVYNAIRVVTELVKKNMYISVQPFQDTSSNQMQKEKPTVMGLEPTAFP